MKGARVVWQGNQKERGHRLLCKVNKEINEKKRCDKKVHCENTVTHHSFHEKTLFLSYFTFFCGGGCEGGEQTQRDREVRGTECTK